MQLGAFRNKTEKEFNALERYGEIFRKDYGDGYIRYLIGEFDTYDEALACQKKLNATGWTNVFVTAEKSGQRILLK